MFKHHTKTKGDLGVLKVKVDLFQQGYLTLNPETEHAPFDLVAYKDGVFKKVQVKYRSLSKRGVLEIPFRNSYSFSKGVVTKPIDKEEVDVFAVFCPESDECYYFESKQFHKSLTLRIGPSANNQKDGIHLASAFRKMPE